MVKVKLLVLLLGFLLASKWCCGNVEETYNNVESVPITIIKAAGHGGYDKSNSISASIDGHDLTVIFLNDLGNVIVKITTAAGVVLDSIGMMTPNGYIYYIPNAGNYIVTFILENGDEYYGEFTVTE